MKRLIPSWTVIQAIILVLLVCILLWPDQSDGRIVCEVDDFWLNHITRIDDYPAISLLDSQSGEWMEIVVKAPIIKATWVEPDEAVRKTVQSLPYLFDLLPRTVRQKMYGGWLLKVSMTPKEWDALQSARRIKVSEGKLMIRLWTKDDLSNR